MRLPFFKMKLLGVFETFEDDYRWYVYFFPPHRLNLSLKHDAGLDFLWYRLHRSVSFFKQIGHHRLPIRELLRTEKNKLPDKTICPLLFAVVYKIVTNIKVLVVSKDQSLVCAIPKVLLYPGQLIRPGGWIFPRRCRQYIVSKRSASVTKDSIAPGTGSMSEKIPGTSSSRFLYSITTSSGNLGTADRKSTSTLSIST